MADREAGREKQSREPEPEIIRTDTETEQDSVKTKWRKVRLREKALRLFSRNYQILIEEVRNTFKTFGSLYSCCRKMRIMKKENQR